MTDSPIKDRTKEFLFEEYKAAQQLTFHNDELRSKLTNFSLTFSALALTGLILLIKGDYRKIYELQAESAVIILLFVCSILTAIIVLIVSRLRSSQLEYFRIINNIRSYFFQNDLELWNTIELSERTIPRPTFKSGSYFWALLIMLISTLFFAAGVLLWEKALIYTSLSSLLWFTLLNIFYFQNAKPR